MTDEQLSGLAKLTLLNASVLGSLAGTVSTLTEKLLPLLPDQSASVGLLSDLKQLQGIVAGLSPALELARKDLVSRDSAPDQPDRHGGESPPITESIMDEIEECYRLFELEPGAGAEAVKQAYRELLKVWHPDRFPDAKLQKRATEKAKALNEAYRKITAYLSDACTEPRASAKATAAAEDDMQATEAEDDFVEEEDFAWTLKSAQGGNSWNQCAVAEMYLEGTKIPKNEAEAFRWYLADAAQGNSEGMFNVGKSYLEGAGVEADKNEAIKWLSRLAYPATTEDWFCACGWTGKMLMAQIYMAQIHYSPGEPHNPAMAYGWLLLAFCYAQPSNVEVAQYDAWKLECASMLQQKKEKLESELSAEQRAKGQKMAAELFRPKDYLEAKAERMQKEQEAVAERSLKEEEDGPRSGL